jgi:hypothetical protein
MLLYINIYSVFSYSSLHYSGKVGCTQKDHALVEYAIANMDNRLFVSKYQLELPRKEELERFLENKRREITEG